MNEARSRFVVPAYRRRMSGWKRFTIGAVGGGALFVGVLLVALVGWGVVEAIRDSSGSVLPASVWGLFLSAVVGGVMWAKNTEGR